MEKSFSLISEPGWRLNGYALHTAIASKRSPQCPRSSISDVRKLMVRLGINASKTIPRSDSNYDIVRVAEHQSHCWPRKTSVSAHRQPLYFSIRSSRFVRRKYTAASPRALQLLHYPVYKISTPSLHTVRPHLRNLIPTRAVLLTIITR